MQRAGLPAFISKKITDGDVADQIKQASTIFNKTEKIIDNCKIIVSLSEGEKIRDSIVSENTKALYKFMTVINEVNKKFNTERNEKKENREIDPKKVELLVDTRGKEIKNGEKVFLYDIKNTIALPNIKGKLQIKSDSKKIQDEHKDKESLNCNIIKLDPYNRKIYFKLDTAKKSNTEHSIDIKYLCIVKEEKEIKKKSKSDDMKTSPKHNTSTTSPKHNTTSVSKPNSSAKTYKLTATKTK